jgi:hypothetical protein
LDSCAGYYGITERYNLYRGQNAAEKSDNVHDQQKDQDHKGSYKYVGLEDPAYDHRNASFFLDRQRSDYQNPTRVNPNCFTLRSMDYNAENFEI